MFVDFGWLLLCLFWCFCWLGWMGFIWWFTLLVYCLRCFENFLFDVWFEFILFWVVSWLVVLCLLYWFVDLLILMFGVCLLWNFRFLLGFVVLFLTLGILWLLMWVGCLAVCWIVDLFIIGLLDLLDSLLCWFGC